MEQQVTDGGVAEAVLATLHLAAGGALRSELFFKACFFLTNSILYCSWGAWFVVVKNIREDTALADGDSAPVEDSAEGVYDENISSTGVLWLFAFVNAIVVYPLLYCLIVRQERAELAAKENADDDEVEFKCKLSAKVLAVVVDTSSYLVVVGFQGAIIASAPDSEYSTRQWWAWLFVFMFALSGAFGAHAIDEIGERRFAEDPVKRKRLGKLSLLWNTAFAWQTAVMLGEAVVATILNSTDGGDTGAVTAEVVSSAWVYLLCAFAVSLAVFKAIQLAARRGGGKTAKKEVKTNNDDLRSIVLPEVIDYLSTLKQLIQKVAVLVAGLALRDAVKLTVIFYGSSQGFWDSEATESASDLFAMAWGNTLVSVLLAIAVERTTRHLLTTRERTLAEVVAFEDFCSIVTTALGYVAGTSWNGYVSVRWGPASDSDLANLVVFAFIITALGIGSMMKLEETFPSRQAKALAIDFKKAKSKAREQASDDNDVFNPL